MRRRTVALADVRPPLAGPCAAWPSAGHRRSPGRRAATSTASPVARARRGLADRSYDRRRALRPDRDPCPGRDDGRRSSTPRSGARRRRVAHGVGQRAAPSGARSSARSRPPASTPTRACCTRGWRRGRRRRRADVALASDVERRLDRAGRDASRRVGRRASCQEHSLRQSIGLLGSARRGAGDRSACPASERDLAPSWPTDAQTAPRARPERLLDSGRVSTSCIQP